MTERDMVQLTAFFPVRVFCFGRWQEGHMYPERWLPRSEANQIIDFAKKVQDAGGLFYMNGRKYKHVDVWPGTPKAYSIILQDGYVHVSAVLADTDKAIAFAKLLSTRKQNAKARALAKSLRGGADVAAGDKATARSGEAKRLYVPVTRKVSPEIRTPTRKVSLTAETKDGNRGA